MILPAMNFCFTARMEELLNLKLERQYLIISYIGIRLEVIDFFVSEYHNNTSVLRNNVFIYESTLAIYRGIMIALNELYSASFSIHDNSLLGITTLGRMVLKSETLIKLEDWLAKNESKILLLRRYCKNRIRTKHFLKQQSIKIDFKDLSLARSLYTLALKVVRLVSDANHKTKLTANIYKEGLLNLIKVQ